MKKLLLSLFVFVALVSAAKAETVTFDLTSGYENAQVVTTLESGSVTILLSGGGNNNPPAWYKTGTALRMYPKNIMSFSTSSATEVIKSVTFTFSAASNNFVTGTKTEPIVSAGSYTESSTVGTWAGASDAFTLTAGGTSGHARISQIKVELGSFGGVLAPTFSIAEGTFYETQQVALDCATEGAVIYYTTNGDVPTSSSTVYATPIKVETTTTIKAIASKDGLNSDVAEALYTIIPPVAIANIAAFNTQAADVVVKFSNPVTVVYQNANYMFVEDATGALQIFGSTGHSYQSGDVIPAGFMGTVSVYGGLIQLKPISDTFEAGVAGSAVEPLVVTTAQITTALMNKLVKVLNVTIDNKVITDAAGNATLFSRFSNVTIPTDAERYNVTAIVNSYNGNLQLFPTEFVLSAGSGLADVENGKGVNVFAGYNVINVETAENTQVVVVNALGQLVASKALASGAHSIAVAPGFYVVRVDDSVAKVVVK